MKNVIIFILLVAALYGGATLLTSFNGKPSAIACIGC